MSEHRWCDQLQVLILVALIILRRKKFNSVDHLWIYTGVKCDLVPSTPVPMRKLIYCIILIFSYPFLAAFALNFAYFL